MSTQKAPPKEKLPEGYAVACAQWNGHTYELTYYRGFVGGAAVQPLGPEGPTVPFDIPREVYRVPQPDGHVGPMKGPDGKSFVKLRGGPHTRTLQVDIDNSPNGHAEKYKGPLAGFNVVLRHSATAAVSLQSAAVAAAGAGVDVVEGADQVVSIDVRYHSDAAPFAGAAGAARAFDGGTPPAPGDEVLIVENNASCCPPKC
ncbi:MAG: hypothetical protein JWM27_2731 [Gemmatimonadetes bacterium]|nr:hypothetical protein [Gemmatimonadota bacterium]